MTANRSALRRFTARFPISLRRLQASPRRRRLVLYGVRHLKCDRSSLTIQHSTHRLPALPALMRLDSGRRAVLTVADERIEMATEIGRASCRERVWQYV